MINIKQKKNEKLEKNEINVFLEYSEDTNIDSFVKYIKKYDDQKVLVKQNNEYRQIDYQDIILFYSDKKYIY